MSDSLGAVHVVPPVACKLGLIEESAVGAEERRALGTFATVMAYVVSLEENKVVRRLTNKF